MSAILGAPWRWDDGWGEVEDATGRTVASVSAEYEPAGPALAAVPELLAALEAAESVVRQGGHSAVGRMIRAALAKAKGEG